MKHRRGRIYWRERGGARRAYGDFRDYADVGGGREALVARGEKLATADPDVAAKLVADRLADLNARRRNRGLTGLAHDTTLAAFAREHLVAKAEAGKVTERWLESAERHLQRAVDHFGGDRSLTSLTVAEVRGWLSRLQDDGLTGGTVRHHLNALSNLYRRAQGEGYVLPGFNPAAAVMDKPTAARREAKWLEPHLAALLLESARTYQPRRPDMACPYAYELIATFLLTGGRRTEVLGLEAQDISFDRRTVTFRPNGWRRLKTATSWRVVPLWPQLEAILRPYVFGTERAPSALLFPSFHAAERGARADEHVLTEPRKLLDAVGTRAGWQAGEVRTKMFRHTYCAARLQTLDSGAPVARYTVARELGHGGTALVDRVYGHLGEVRHRAEAVEFRVEQHEPRIRERLRLIA